MQTKRARTALRGAAVGLMIVSAGCSAARSDYQDGTRFDEPAAVTVDHCPSAAGEIPRQDDFGQLIGPGRLAKDFRPVSAVRCTWTGRYLNDAATQSETTVEEVRSPSITSALSASLDLPDQEFRAESHAACSAVATALEYLIFVDSDGRAFSPRLPQSPCGDPRDEVARAITDMSWGETKTYVFRTPA